VEFRVDKAGIVHCPWEDSVYSAKPAENAHAIIVAVVKASRQRPGQVRKKITPDLDHGPESAWTSPRLSYSRRRLKPEDFGTETMKKKSEKQKDLDNRRRSLRRSPRSSDTFQGITVANDTKLRAKCKKLAASIRSSRTRSQSAPATGTPAEGVLKNLRTFHRLIRIPCG